VGVIKKTPFDVSKELHGWLLFWAELESRPGYEEQLAALRSRGYPQT